MKAEKMHAPARARSPRTGAIALAMASALALILLALAPAPAQAAVKDAITSVTVNPDAPDQPITQYDKVDVKATWTAPTDTVAGDTFELTLPDFLEGVRQNFTLKDKTGATVGTCEVQATEIVCTFTDYVESHENVSGSLFFSVQAQKATTEETWVWNKDTSHEMTTTVVGGVGKPREQVPPIHSEKWSWQITNGKIRWMLMLRGDEIVTPGGNSMLITDTMDPRLTIDPNHFVVDSATDAQYRAEEWPALPADAYTTTFSEHGFTIQFRNVDPAKFYRVYYDVEVPAGTVKGDTFTNRVQANGTDFIEDTYVAQQAGGDGGGTQRNGEVSWSKVDSNDAALAGSAWELTAADGTTVAVTDNGTNDADPAEGRLRATGLAWGTYTLRETEPVRWSV